MPIDINLLRAFKGGAPNIVKLSQKNRFKDIAIVDTVISQDEVIILICSLLIAMEKTSWRTRQTKQGKTYSLQRSRFLSFNLTI